MKRKLLTTAAVFAALFFVGPAANAATYYFYTGGTPGNWNTGANWWSTGCGTGTNGTIPNANDHAVICSGEICNVAANAVADTIEVQTSATLNIQASMVLTLDGSANSTSYVEGTGRIYLQGSGSELSFTTNDHTISYVSSAGEIVGQHDSALITLDTNSQVLTSEIPISGALAITESGTPSDTRFVNSSTVSANLASGTLELSVDYLDDGMCYAPGDWEVSASSAVLKFTADSTFLSGDFTVSSGTLDIDTDVWTSGSLSFTGGTIDVADGVSFETGQTATVYYFYVDGAGTPGAASNSNNWYTDSCECLLTQDGVPGANDRAVICSGQTCNVTANTTWDTVDVRDDATLNIGASYTLTLQNNDNNLGGGAGNDHSLVEEDAAINLLASGGQYGTLAFTDNDHNLGHSNIPGSVIGADHGCQITLGSDYLDLTSSITISGALTITESGGGSTDTRFINDHEVEADLASGTLELDVDYLDDGTCSTGDWKVSASSATLLFSVGSTQLSGDFNISNSGTLDIDSTVHTEGDLIFGTGVLDTTGGEFKANQDLGCS
jgi:hypothetical protein